MIDMKTIKISVSVDKELLSWIDKEAEQQRRTRSGIIDVAITFYKKYVERDFEIIPKAEEKKEEAVEPRRAVIQPRLERAY